MPDAVQEIIQNLNERQLHASAWILWRPVGPGEFQIISQFGFGSGNLQQLTAEWEGHDELLQQVLATKTDRRASANSQQIQDTETEPLNLIATPVISKTNVIAILELFFQTSAQLDAAIQGEALKMSLCDIAKMLETKSDSESENQLQLAEYLHQIISETESEQLPHVIANAICAKYEVGRCSLFSICDKSVRLQGVSGHPDYESRSEIIRNLHEVVSSHASSATEQSPNSKLTDEELLLLKSQAAWLIRLGKVFHGCGLSQPAEGLMLLEYFEQPQSAVVSIRPSEELLETLPLWKLGLQSSRLKNPGGQHSKKQIVFLSTIITAVVCLLFFLPVELTIRAPGQVVPVTRHHLFAPESGVINTEDLHLPETGKVLANQHLVTITNQELILLRSQLDGKIATIAEEIRSLKNRRPERDTEREQRLLLDQDLSIRLAEAQIELKGLQQEKNHLQHRIQSLQIRSPHPGQLLSWDAEHQLAGRPVSRGQLLLTVGDNKGEWEVLADVPQNNMGPLKKISQSKSIPFTITLDTNAKRKWEGKLTRISSIVLQQNSDEFVLPVTGRLSRKMDDVLPGSRVTMRISCGNYPLGYVLFRGPIETIRSYMVW